MATESTESKALEVVPTTPKGIITSERLKAEAEQRKLLSQFISQQMVKDVDYGEIPGTKKPTLLKPGAEKLTDLFRCTPKFHLVKIEEDHDRGFFNYVFRVRLYQRDADAVLAEGFGSANSREGRYRWRDAQRKCPGCGSAAIIKGKAEYGGGWVCFAKRGGCGAKFRDGDAAIESQALGRVENDDIATLANTILKMAKKRALVDGAIALARCSDMFTQDVEDYADLAAEPPAPTPPQQQQATASGRRSAPKDTSAKEQTDREAERAKHRPAERARVSRLWKAAEGAGMDLDTFKAWIATELGGEKSSADLTDVDMTKLEAAMARGTAEQRSQ